VHGVYLSSAVPIQAARRGQLPTIRPMPKFRQGFFDRSNLVDVEVVRF
jgi:hypothetical protein